MSLRRQPSPEEGVLARSSCGARAAQSCPSVVAVAADGCMQKCQGKNRLNRKLDVVSREQARAEDMIAQVLPEFAVVPRISGVRAKRPKFDVARAALVPMV